MGASATIDYNSESIKDRVSVIMLYACYWSLEFVYKYMLKYAFCAFICKFMNILYHMDFNNCTGGIFIYYLTFDAVSGQRIHRRKRSECDNGSRWRKGFYRIFEKVTRSSLVQCTQLLLVELLLWNCLI